MAVLNCYLCEQPVDRPVATDGKTFCCHGCRDLWALLGDEQLSQLKRQPGIDWTAARGSVQADDTPSADPDARVSANFQLTGLSCASCTLLVEHVVNRLPGVAGAVASYTAESLQVQFDPGRMTSTEICETVSRLGYDIQAADADPSEPSRPHHGLMRRFVVSTVLSLVLMMASVPVWSGYLPDLPAGLRLLLSATLWLLATPVVFWAGWPFLRGAWTSVLHRVPTMDLLIGVASLAAYGYSVVNVQRGGRYLYFDTCAFLITFLLLGRILETGTRERALALTRQLAGLAVREATVICQGGEQRVPVSSLRPGDLVLVRPGARVPVDGVVREGRSDIDQSFLTGESLFSQKHPGDYVYAGSTNGTGRLVVTTTRRTEETVLAQTLQFVRDAQAAGHVYRRLTERVLRVFIPGVLALGALTFCLWAWVIPAGLSTAALRAIAALVIACPCALSVAAPVASQCAVQRLGQRGVLLRSDEAIERCAGIDTVVFDKTGTLTRGRVQLAGCWPDDSRLLQLAASCESASEHPFGRAVVAAARERGLSLLPATEVVVHPGEGVGALVAGVQVDIRRYTGLPLPGDLAGSALALGRDGHSLSVVAVNGVPRAVLSFADTLRADAAQAVSDLQARGVDVHMATGDRSEAAKQVAHAAGIASWRAGMTPLEKSGYIQSLQAAGRRVAYIGDGMNDAAALIQADLGIAMGSGTDIAIQAGHLVLMQSRLAAIPFALTTCRKTVAITRQNIGFAIAYNLAALAAAVFGFAEPAAAAAAMVMSSAFVLGNALRILGHRLFRYARRVSLVVGSAAVLFVLVHYGV